MSLSLRGILRRYLKTPHSDTVSVSGLLTPDSKSLRVKLEAIAREEHSYLIGECIFVCSVGYEQIWSHINVRISLVGDPDVPFDTLNMKKAVWKDGIERVWNNRWGCALQGEATCPFTFKVQWVDLVPLKFHHTVNIHLVRQNHEGTDEKNWFVEDGGDVAAHEFGHMLGLVDEYPDSICPNRNPVNTGTVMDNNSSDVPSRMMVALAENIGSFVSET